LVEFYSACDIYNVVEDDVACQLLILTLKRNGSKWLYSLLPRTITSWYVLENLFFEKYFPRKDPYSLFLKLVEILMNQEETVKYITSKFMKSLHEIPQGCFQMMSSFLVVMKMHCL
jgi:hypothetical protein